MNWQHLSPETIVRLHDVALRHHGGLIGVRDWDVLYSALARAQHVATYKPDSVIFDIAAAVGFGIICNHPFIDGNKRTGLLAMVEILRANGELKSYFHIPEKPTYQMILSVARAEKTTDELAIWLRKVVITATEV